MANLMSVLKIVLPMVIGVGILGCFSSEKTVSMHKNTSEQQSTNISQMSADTHHIYAWTGKYQAVIPCENCDATLVELSLNDDLSYSLSKNHINNDGFYPVASVGLFSIKDNNPKLLQLDGAADYHTIEVHDHGVTLHAPNLGSALKNIRLIKTS